MTDLFRVVDVQLTDDGRTLEGIAFKWDTPSRVQDPDGPPYREAFMRDSLKDFLARGKKVPLGVLHGVHAPCLVRPQRVVDGVDVAGLLPQISVSGLLSSNKQSKHRVFRSPTSTAPNYGANNMIEAAATGSPGSPSTIPRSATRLASPARTASSRS